MKYISLLALLFLLPSCILYTEKQSEAIKQNVYATNDSLNNARVDLAYFYSNETTKFINPPKHPIKISAVYQADDVIKTAKTAGKTRVVIVPEQYKDNKVIVVGSTEYQSLLKDREIKKQLEQDNKNMVKQLDTNNKELAKQNEMHDKMVKDLNHLQSEIYKKDAIIFKEALAIGVLLVGIVGYIWLKISRFALF